MLVSLPHLTLFLAVNFVASHQSCNSSVPKSCLLDPIATTLLKTYLDDFGAFDLRNCNVYNLIHKMLVSLPHLTLFLAVNFVASHQSCNSSVPKSCLLDPIATTLLKTYLDDFGAFDLRNCNVYNLIHKMLVSLPHLTLFLAVNFVASHQSCNSSVPKSCLLDPIATTLLKTYLDDFGAFDLRNFERITVVWVCFSAVQGSKIYIYIYSLGAHSKINKNKQPYRLDLCQT